MSSDDEAHAYYETFNDPVYFMNIRPIVADEYERRLLHAVLILAQSLYQCRVGVRLS